MRLETTADKHNISLPPDVKWEFCDVTVMCKCCCSY